MRRAWMIGMAAAGVALLGAAAAYAELSLDWRTQCSGLKQRGALGTTVSMSLSTQSKRLDVLGIFVVGPPGATETTFPFRLAPGQDLAHLDRNLADGVRNYFENSGFPKNLLEFTDSDWSIDDCQSLPPGLGLGRLGEWLTLRQGTACIVTWKRAASMLVSVSLADGDPWLRPFSRRLCRAITEAALAAVDPGGRDGPAYAACILIDRPARLRAPEALIEHIYSVGLYHQLAAMN